MAIEIITKEDLQIFREVLIAELKDLLYPVVAKPIKSWLKATEVRKLLGISANTLQNLRVTGKLHPKKVGGINYYRYSDIVQLLDGTE
jgi:hypothetical protein